MNAAHKVSPGGSFRFNRTFRGVGRIWIASGTKNRQRFKQYDAMLTELFEGGYLDILRAIKARTVSPQEAYEAKRQGRLRHLLSDYVLTRPLWPAVDAWVPTSAAKPASRKRYDVSMKSLRRNSPLRDNATIEDLASVDWRALRDAWPKSPADFNRMRSAVSRFLTLTLGDKWHPFRRQVMSNETFPRAAEPDGREPDIPIDLFWKIVYATPKHVQACYVALAVTGMRVRSEFLALEPRHLLHDTLSVRVPGTKTAGSKGIVQVGRRGWPYLVAVVPSPVQYKMLRTHFDRACVEVGVPDLVMHDLRHLYGQNVADRLPEAAVQGALRTKDPRTTRRYTRRKDKGEAAAVVDLAIFGPDEPEEEAKKA